MPEPVNVVKLRTYTDTLYDLLTAYATERVRKLGGKSLSPPHAPVLLIEEARERLERMLGRIPDWSALYAAAAVRMVGRQQAPLGACEHVARLPGTGPRRQGRDPPAEAVRRDLRQGPVHQAQEAVA